MNIPRQSIRFATAFFGLCLLSTTSHRIFAQGTASEPVSPFADKPCDSYSAYRDETGKQRVSLKHHAERLEVSRSFSHLFRHQ